MGRTRVVGNAVELFEPDTEFAVGTYDLGPFDLGGYSGFLLDITRSDDGTNGTATITLMVDDISLGLQSQLDGAGAAVAINGWGAGENERRQLQVHPSSGPANADDADGVFQVGTTGVASSYYRQSVLDPFTFRLEVATDASVFSGAVLHFLR
jgi:hypothetical protein